MYDGLVLRCILGQEISAGQKFVGSTKLQVETESKCGEISLARRLKFLDLGMYLCRTISHIV